MNLKDMQFAIFYTSAKAIWLVKLSFAENNQGIPRPLSQLCFMRSFVRRPLFLICMMTLTKSLIYISDQINSNVKSKYSLLLQY